ncbi:MAG: terminase, partial [Brachymonas sp.]
MLYGDFRAGIEDDPWQVIPTAWVEAAQARWRRPDRLEPMDSVGVDVARGGRDKTVIARRHGMWFDTPLEHPGTATPDGPTVAGLTMAAMRDGAVVHIDVIGVGSSPYDFLKQARQQVVGVNVSEAATRTDKSGRLRFFNLRTQLWWAMREALDPANNTGIALPPAPALLADLCAPLWRMSGTTIQVESREDIIKRTGHSPDHGSAYCLALIDTPKRTTVEALGHGRRDGRGHDPFAIL